MPKYTVGSASHPGMRKSTNEDSYAVYPPEKGAVHPKGLLLALGDGMGGRAGGATASKIAVDVLLESYYSDSSKDVASCLRRGFLKAHEAVLRQGEADRQHQGLASTLTAAVLLGDRMYHAHVGDSRLYLVEKGGMSIVTEDHSFVASLVRAGAITQEQAESHPQRNLVTQAIGAAEELRIDLSESPRKIGEGDYVLICCDGLYKELGDSEIQDTIRNYPDPATACEKLIQLANDHGGDDNITAVLARIDDTGGIAGKIRRILHV